jgi:hypothetical protein
MSVRSSFLLSLVLAFSVSFEVIAQTGDTIYKKKINHFLEVGLGLDYHAVRDKGTSPLTYRGLLPSIHLQYFIRNDRFLGILDENFHIGSIYSRESSGKSKAVSYNNTLSFNSLFKVQRGEKYRFLLGGELGSLANVRVNDRFSNADLNYDIMVFLAPSAMVEFNTFHKGGKMDLGLFSMSKRPREFKFQYAAAVPVFTALLRPGFVTINDFVDDNSLTMEPENTSFVSFNHLFVIKNRFTLYYILHNENMIKFNYNFDYFSYYRGYNPVKGFHSGFMLSLVFRFNNHN